MGSFKFEKVDKYEGVEKVEKVCQAELPKPSKRRSIQLFKSYY